MPLYEYRCVHCGQVFEKMIRWSEAEKLPVCPNCGSTQTQKKVSVFASAGSSDSGASGGRSCGSGGGFS